MRVLLTGASGFLGSHLARGLVAAGHLVTAAVRGSSDLGRIEDILGRIRLVDLDLEGIKGLFQVSALPEAVIHTATCYGREESEAGDVYKSNVLFPVELAKTATGQGVNIFINTDTFFPPDYPPLSAYARSKKQFADWGRSHSPGGGYLFVNLRLEHLYGPDDSDGKFIPFLIKNCLDDTPEIPLTDGHQKRDFIHITDAVQAYLTILARAADLGSGYREFNVGTGRSVSIRDLAVLIRQTARSGSTLLFGAVPVHEGELMDSRANVEELKALGWSPRVSLEEGIAQTVQYYAAGPRGKGP